MWFLYRLRVRPNLIEVHELTVKVGLFLGPYFLHRQHSLTQQAPSLFEVGAVILHHLRIAAAADEKYEPDAGNDVEAGHLFCSDDRVTLDNEMGAGGVAKFL